jgi:hypothetical protein
LTELKDARDAKPATALPAASFRRPRRLIDMF